MSLRWNIDEVLTIATTSNQQATDNLWETTSHTFYMGINHNVVKYGGHIIARLCFFWKD